MIKHAEVAVLPAHEQVVTDKIAVTILLIVRYAMPLSISDKAAYANALEKYPKELAESVCILWQDLFALPTQAGARLQTAEDFGLREDAE